MLHVAGADLLNGTPIYDIKPYLPYVDSHPEAQEGFAGRVRDYGLEVHCPPELLEKIPAEHREAIRALLEQDPRPSYQKDPQRIYGLKYAGLNVRFHVDGTKLTVYGVERS